MNNTIKIQNGKLIVPDQPVIPFIEGDGIGKDISIPSQRVLNAAVEKSYGGKRKLLWKEVLAGEKAFQQTGENLPDTTLDTFREYLVGMKGPLQTPVGGGIRSLNVALRQTLDLYVCLRPVRWFKGVPSPIRYPSMVDMHIFRENTEDIYAGIEYMTGEENTKKFSDFLINEMGVEQIRFPESTSFGVKPISKEGSERLVRAAIKYAIERKLPSVTIVHKGNIMKFTEGAFKNWGYDLAENEYSGQTFTWRQYEKIKKEKGEIDAQKALKKAEHAGNVIVKDVITDAFLQESLLRPFDHSVIATMNLNGDYISDQLAAMVGGIGISPGANINYNSGYAIFEATHGTAPNIAGTGKANPSSLILSGVMMLEYLGWTEAAEHVLDAMEHTFSKRRVTSDLYDMMEGATLLTTSEFADEIIRNIH
ncbi:MAG: isocitrate dehydrogenase (NADP(+)) [Bacteroidetes bacterium GWF2_42_66]|nr:MAG: isocitrate dehydrogenase (NADP(+)) [Bacteroidetes bacterium GWA2_42_15]OFY01364.1 MAG: isocitrate dehydrogenase (NADP(+)) [Bacteroidetes bacterium GWE2_42_39]OFY42208.1 MAG: isocitrate dehydrogenase (NADP(+)) [Bacteroidetes bacterium GWF2_42_66]HBL77575.1 NADP-dependent isocitrate dehydrogenase [Prolixibacteraceae bacterium]HCB62705.1 NADP-dependent isocitrate dehydrogenase [Bacteroidales bacterium]